MTTSRTRRVAHRGVLAATGVLATLLLSACGGLTGSAGAATTGAAGPSGGPASAGSSAAGSAPNAASGGSAPAAAGSSGSSPAAVRTPECRSTNLRVSLGQSDGAAGHVYQALLFTNTSGASCVIVGFPGVSYVTGDSGTQVGAPAVRDGSIGPQVTLRPGQVASAIVDKVDVAVFDPAVCQPTPTRGFRVYPPDETHSVFVAQDGTGCAGNPPSPQLRVQTIKPGPGNP